MADQQAKYRDPTENNFPNDYDAADVDDRITLRSKAVREKQKGVDVRGALAQGIEIAGVVAGEGRQAGQDAKDVATSLNQRWDDQINGKVDPEELIDYRRSDMLEKTFTTARLRGDFVDKDLQQRGVNVRWFGAVGDGVTDDTQAFLDAITFANSKGFSVYVPLGKYLITKTLNIAGLHFRGNHQSDTYIFPKGLDILFQLGDDTYLTDLCISDRLNGADIVNVALGGAGIDSGGDVIERLTIKGTQDGFNSTFLLAAPTGTKDENHHVFPNTIRDIAIFDVYDAVVFDSANYGWINGNLVENINVQGFLHSAIWLNASAENGVGISHNTFRNIQAEYLPGTPSDARAFRINCGVNNRFEMVHTWTDGSEVPPSLCITKADAIANDYDIRNNVFSGVFESDIEITEVTRKFNDFSLMAESKWYGSHFSNQVAAINGFNTSLNQNLLSEDLISDFGKKGVISPIQLGGATKMKNVGTGIDDRGPYLQINSDATDSITLFLPLLGTLNSQIRSIKTLTIGVDFSLGADTDEALMTMIPSFMYLDPTNNNRFAPTKLIQQAARGTDNVYRYTMGIDNSAAVATNYSQAFLSVTAKGSTVLKIRRLILTAGLSSINNKVEIGHSSKPHTTVIAKGAAADSYTNIGLFLLPDSQVANYPQYSAGLLTTKTDAAGNQFVTYPLYY